MARELPSGVRIILERMERGETMVGDAMVLSRLLNDAYAFVSAEEVVERYRMEAVLRAAFAEMDA